MKIINAGYQLIEEPSITKKIEKVARVCYKSEDKIDEGTDMIMCRSLINRQHTAMLEHGSLVLEVGEQEYTLIETIRSFMENMVEEGEDNKKCFLRYTNCADESKNYSIDNLHYVVSGNIRAWYEFMQYANSIHGLPAQLYNLVNDNVNNIFDIDITEFDSIVFNIYDSDDFYAKVITDMSILSDEERMVHETFSVLFTVDRGVTHELVRMRDCSFAQESTRYVSYSKKTDIVNTKEDVLYLYCEAGMSMKKIADRSNGKYTEWDIYKILEENNIQKRTLGSRGIIYENYFEIIDQFFR